MPTTRRATDATIDWLLEGDPAIRWQTMRDLMAAPARTVDRERKRVATDGWGARLLAKQDRAGTWDGGKSPDVGLYTPKWTSATYTLLLLRDFGLSPNNAQARKACTLLLDRGMQPDGGINFGTWAKWVRRGETCITGMVLSILSYFEYDDDRLDAVADQSPRRADARRRLELPARRRRDAQLGEHDDQRARRSSALRAAQRSADDRGPRRAATRRASFSSSTASSDRIARAR